MIRVIGLCGRAGSGKSTVARMLVNAYCAVPIGLADYFKVPAVAIDKLPAQEVFGPLGKSATTRHFLQQRGTEQGRDVNGDDHWIRHLDAHLYRLQEMGVKRVVVDDVRFLNESEFIRNLPCGEVWRITGRGGLEGEAAQHRSERDIDAIQATFTLDNRKDIDSLWRAVDGMAWTFWGPKMVESPYVPGHARQA